MSTIELIVKILEAASQTVAKASEAIDAFYRGDYTKADELVRDMNESVDRELAARSEADAKARERLGR